MSQFTGSLAPSKIAPFRAAILGGPKAQLAALVYYRVRLLKANGGTDFSAALTTLASNVLNGFSGQTDADALFAAQIAVSAQAANAADGTVLLTANYVSGKIQTLMRQRGPTLSQALPYLEALNLIQLGNGIASP